MAVSTIKNKKLRTQQVANVSITVPANASAWMTVPAPTDAVSVSGYYLDNLFLSVRSVTFANSSASFNIRNWSSSPITSTMSVEFLIQP